MLNHPRHDRHSASVVLRHRGSRVDSDGLSISDVESANLAGRIPERQMDRPWGERKYVVRGRPLEGDDAVIVVAKLGPTGQVVILTVCVE